MNNENSAAAKARARPKYLNLFKIRLPAPGVLSIFHRISGVLLIYALPFALWFLQRSVADAEGYDYTLRVFGGDGNPLAKLLAWGVAWALFHHLCAGARFLLLDFHIGVGLEAARFSAFAAFAVSILMTVVFGVWLW